MGVRVVFTGPSDLHEAGKPPVGLLSLELLGSGPTAVTTASQPARLVFSGRYLESGREPSGEFSDFAELEGNIRLSSNGEPEFKDTGAAQFTGELPAPDSNVQQADLLLKAGGASVALSKAEGFVVPLPVPPAGAQFLEVGVELEVAGAVEAGKDVNDRLDVRAFRSIKVKLEDSDGKPVPAEAFEVRGSRRQRVKGQLDDRGEARVLGLSGTHCQVIFPNLQPEIVALDTGEDEEEAPVGSEPSPPASEQLPPDSQASPPASANALKGPADPSA